MWCNTQYSEERGLGFPPFVDILGNVKELPLLPKTNMEKASTRNDVSIMTRVCIVYSTKRKKATVQVVEWLKVAFESNGLEVEVGKPEEINTQDCDLFVLGTSVYAGAVQEPILAFIDQNQDLLREKPVATFIVCKEVETPECHMNLVIEKLPKEPMTWINFEGYLLRKGDFEKQQSKANTWVKDIISRLS